MRSDNRRFAVAITLPDDPSVHTDDVAPEQIAEDCEYTTSPESAVAAYLTWFNKKEPVT